MPQSHREHRGKIIADDVSTGQPDLISVAAVAPRPLWLCGCFGASVFNIADTQI